MAVEPITVHAFLLTTGAPLYRLPYTGVSMTETLNEAGSMSVEVVWNAQAALLPIRDTLYPWRVGLAAVRGDEVLHAGPVTARKWDPSGQKLTFTVGGGWSLFSKRLVVKKALDTGWSDGEVVMDEDNPAAAWTATYTGSYTDIGSQLIEEALKWGALAVDLPARDGGLYTRTYLGWDFALVSDRLSDLTKLENGDELEFQPYRDSAGRFRWQFRGAPELMDETWQWNCAAPGQRVTFTGVDEDGDAMTSQVWGLGGRSDDLVLATRVESEDLTGAGWPMLQTSNTSHSTVSELSTLQSWCAEDIVRGSVTQESFEFSVGTEYPVHPGDWADVKIDDVYLGRRTLPVKITEVSRSLSEFMTVRGSLREDS